MIASKAPIKDLAASPPTRQAPAQLADAATASATIGDVTLIGCKDVVKRTSISRAGVYRMVSAGAFPRPVPVYGSRIAWIKAEVDDWIAQRVAQRDAGCST